MIVNRRFGPLFHATDTVFCNMLTENFNISRKDYERYVMLHKINNWWGDPHEGLMYALLQGADIKSLIRGDLAFRLSERYVWNNHIRHTKFRMLKMRTSRRATRKALLEE